jgi:Trypsin
VIYTVFQVSSKTGPTLVPRSIIKRRQRVTQDQIKEYEKNAKNAPKLDFFYIGGTPQPPGIIICSNNIVKNFATMKFSGLPISKLIIGGELSAPKQFPWQAQLRIENALLCGGSLITETYILTAAHCLIGYVVSNAAYSLLI